MQRWQNFDFAKTNLKSADIAKVPLEDLKLMRGIVFGRHGRVFKDAEITTYLTAQDWYKANPDFQNSMLNATENRNLDLIRDAEASKHPDRSTRRHALLARALADDEEAGRSQRRRMARACARRLRQFTASVSASRGCSNILTSATGTRPSDNYDAKTLSALEQKNLLTIATAQKKSRKLALAPGDMELFENKLISEQMLHGLSLNELRLLRNEVYARHGRQFQAPWLSQYFFSQPWYQPDENFKDEELSGPDKQNVETIVAYEKKIHDDLGRKPITRSLLEGFIRRRRRQDAAGNLRSTRQSLHQRALVSDILRKLRLVQSQPRFQGCSVKRSGETQHRDHCRL